MRDSDRNPYYREKKQELNHQLYERVQSELAAFQKEMMGRTPQEIYESAHEIAAKHEIAAAFAHTDFSTMGVRALLKSPNLLDDIYEEWKKRGDLPEDGLKGLINEFRAYMVKTERSLSGCER